MKLFDTKFKIAIIAWVVSMLGLFLAFNFNETLGKIIVFICIPIGAYVVFRSQADLIKKILKSKE